MTIHKHKAIVSKAITNKWQACITPDVCEATPYRKAAHGGVIRVDVCLCGATRLAEITATRRNFAPWVALGATAKA